MNPETRNLTLTPPGAARRDAMREELLDAFCSMHRARRIRRRAVLSAALVILATGTGWVGARLAQRGSNTAPRQHAAAPSGLVQIIEQAPSGTAVEFAVVQTRSSTLVTYIEQAAPLVELVDDERLLETLAQMERPAGLIEVGGAVRLTHDVVDDEEGGSTPGRGSGLQYPLVPGNARPSAGV